MFSPARALGFVQGSGRGTALGMALGVLLGIALGLGAAPAGALPLLTASAEGTLPGEQEPPRPLARAVVAALGAGEAASLEQCMRQNGVAPGAYERVFRAVALPRVSTPQPLTFVRPASEPFCGVLHGGHLFRYWLVAQTSDAPAYAIRHAGGGNTVEVLSSGHAGSYDLAETNCTAASCLRRTLHFDGNRYLPVQCELQVYRNGKLASTRAVACEP